MIEELKGIELVTESGLDFKVDLVIAYSVYDNFEEPSSTSMGCPDELEVKEIWLINRKGKKTRVDEKKSFDKLLDVNRGDQTNWKYIEGLLWDNYHEWLAEWKAEYELEIN